MKKILEAKYELADIGKLCRESTHLTAKEKESLFQLLHQFETLFDGFDPMSSHIMQKHTQFQSFTRLRFAPK
jgi:hypothetical protein